MITGAIGEDITDQFDDQGHSNFAKELVQRLTVGHLRFQHDLLDNAYDTVSEEEKRVHERLNSWLDVKKPLLPQVKKMSNREFLAFVRRPRYIEDTDGIQVEEDLEHDESTKSDYMVNLRVVTPVILLFLLYAYHRCESI